MVQVDITNTFIPVHAQVVYGPSSCQDEDSNCVSVDEGEGLASVYLNKINGPQKSSKKNF